MKNIIIKFRDDFNKLNWLKSKENLLVRFHRNRLVGVRHHSNQYVEKNYYYVAHRVAPKHH